MASAWFYQIDGGKHGPVSSTELVELARSGKLKPTDLVQKEGADDWLPAGRVRGLFHSTAAPAPASPTPTAEPPNVATAAKGLFDAVASAAKRVGEKVTEAAKQPPPKPRQKPATEADEPEDSAPEQPALPKVSRRTMIVAGVSGGALLLSCVVCGVVGVIGSTGSVGDPKEAIVGTWESEGQSGSVWVFNADGTATQTLTKVNKQSRYTYTVVGADKIDLVSLQDKSEFVSDELKEKAKLAGVKIEGLLRMASQYKFEGRDRLILLLGDSERPTRISEAERAEGSLLSGKGGGLVVKLRRTKG